MKQAEFNAQVQADIDRLVAQGMSESMRSYLKAEPLTVEDVTMTIRHMPVLSLADVQTVLAVMAARLKHQPGAQCLLDNAMDAVGDYAKRQAKRDAFCAPLVGPRLPAVVHQLVIPAHIDTGVL